MEDYYYRYSLHTLIPDPGFVIVFSELFQGNVKETNRAGEVGSLFLLLKILRIPVEGFLAHLKTKMTN